MNVQLSPTDLRRGAPAVLTLLLALAVAVALGRTYFGSSTSPYGMCTSSSGKQVECATLRAATR